MSSPPSSESVLIGDDDECVLLSEWRQGVGGVRREATDQGTKRKLVHHGQSAQVEYADTLSKSRREYRQSMA